jgi:hypothetical protein
LRSTSYRSPTAEAKIGVCGDCGEETAIEAWLHLDGTPSLWSFCGGKRSITPHLRREWAR